MLTIQIVTFGILVITSLFGALVIRPTHAGVL